jgi:hypothetical protein
MREDTKEVLSGAQRKVEKALSSSDLPCQWMMVTVKHAVFIQY